MGTGRAAAAFYHPGRSKSADFAVIAVRSCVSIEVSRSASAKDARCCTVRDTAGLQVRPQPTSASAASVVPCSPQRQVA